MEPPILQEILQIQTTRLQSEEGMVFNHALDAALDKLLATADAALRGREKFALRARLHFAARSLKEEHEATLFEAAGQYLS